MHAQPCCSAHFWPDKRLQTRLSPQSMLSPIRWEVTSHIPHGLSNSLVLPHVLRFNYETSADSYATLARIIMQGAGEGSASDDAVSESLPDYFEALVDRLMMPSKLRELNVPEDSLPMLARDAMLQQRLLVNNPRKVDEQDALRIYEAAY